MLWNFGHQTCARGAKNTRPHDESPVRLVVQTRPQSNWVVKRAVFTRDLFTCSAGDPSWAISPKFSVAATPAYFFQLARQTFSKTLVFVKLSHQPHVPGSDLGGRLPDHAGPWLLSFILSYA